MYDSPGRVIRKKIIPQLWIGYRRDNLGSFALAAPGVTYSVRANSARHLGNLLSRVSFFSSTSLTKTSTHRIWLGASAEVHLGGGQHVCHRDGASGANAGLRPRLAG